MTWTISQPISAEESAQKRVYASTTSSPSNPSRRRQTTRQPATLRQAPRRLAPRCFDFTAQPMVDRDLKRSNEPCAPAPLTNNRC